MGYCSLLGPCSMRGSAPRPAVKTPTRWELQPAQHLQHSGQCRSACRHGPHGTQPHLQPAGGSVAQHSQLASHGTTLAAGPDNNRSGRVTGEAAATRLLNLAAASCTKELNVISGRCQVTCHRGPLAASVSQGHPALASTSETVHNEGPHPGARRT